MILILLSSFANASIIINCHSYTSMTGILGKVKETSTIYLTKGIHKEGIYTTKNGVQIIGE